MQVGKKPVKKFTGKKISEKRKKRIRRRNFPHLFDIQTSKIIETAEQIIRMPEPEKKRLIFVGQGMRPLFEAVRGLNQIDKAFPRRNVRYYVSPKIAYKHLNLVQEKEIRRFAEKLKELNIVSSGINEYRVFDYYITGLEYKAIEAAVKRVNPEAKVIKINQSDKIFGEAILYSEQIARPTEKDSKGKISGKIEPRMRDEMLDFQQRLHSYLAARL